MIEVIGKDNAKHAMSVMTDEQISIIEKAVQQIERIASISKIDYEKGIVTIALTHNKGTDIEFTEDWLDVNVSCESVGCMTWEIINKVFKYSM